jgi:prepilin-type processing-associated H-X9-DG protein
MEGDAIYNAFNFGHPPISTTSWPLPAGGAGPDVNLTARRNVIEAYFCPSDAIIPMIFGVDGIPTSYRTNIMTRRATVNMRLDTGPISLTPNWSPPCKLRDIIDGTANTAAMSEGLIGNNNANEARVFPRRAVWVVATRVPDVNTAGVLGGPASIAAMVAECDLVNVATAPIYHTGPGHSWHRGDTYHYKYYDHTGTPNKLRCANLSTTATADPNTGSHPPSSLHPGGVNILMCDGTVRFVSDSVNQLVWTAIGTRSSGEAVDNNAF